MNLYKVKTRVSDSLSEIYFKTCAIYMKCYTYFCIQTHIYTIIYSGKVQACLSVQYVESNQLQELQGKVTKIYYQIILQLTFLPSLGSKR